MDAFYNKAEAGEYLQHYLFPFVTLTHPVRVLDEIITERIDAAPGLQMYGMDSVSYYVTRRMNFKLTESKFTGSSGKIRFNYCQRRDQCGFKINSSERTYRRSGRSIHSHTRNRYGLSVTAL